MILRQSRWLYWSSAKSINKTFWFGANGYTAELITELAVQEGSQPILAGRTLHKIEPLASRHGLPFRIFGLDDPKLMAANLAGVAVVLNCAGPFTRTARPLAEICMQAGIHYLDITGEIEVFEMLANVRWQGATTGCDADARGRL